jgi:Kef-type K+ transport system membrane component KefB
MKKGKDLLFYIFVIGGFGSVMYYIFQVGKKLEINKSIHTITGSSSNMWGQFLELSHHNLTSPLATLLLQIITIIVVARIIGLLFRLIGQPMVIGEITAGIIMGPSLFGLYFPEFSSFLFPAQSLGNLQFLSQIGLILFMYIVGMELDLKILKNRASDAVIISHASIIIPFTLGVALAYYLYVNHAPENINFLSFGLFMGIAMSITAFPVLARIVQERGMTRTRVGSLAITCAAADDISAWSILAAVIAIVKAGSIVNSLFTILLALVYIFVMLKIVKPFLRKLGEIHSSKENLSKHIVAVFIIILFLSSVTTEFIGIHALFGAFFAGVIMPDNARFRSIFVEKLEDVAVVIFLPLFFVFTGLRTQIGLLNGSELWIDFSLIIAVAVTGKFAGSAIAAKFVGQNWKDSLLIGALMNTRGLIELVVLNIAYDMNILTAEIFAMLVLMALVTTFMTGPALAIINYIFKSGKVAEMIPEVSKTGKYNILFSFANPARGKAMLKLAHGLIGNSNNDSSITSLHLTPIDNLLHDKLAESEMDSFEPIKEEAQNLQLNVRTIFKPSADINKDIIEIANKGSFQLLIVGMGQSLFEGSFLGHLLGFTTQIIYPSRLLDTLSGKEKLFKNKLFDDRTSNLIKKCKIPIGILIDKEFRSPENILILVFGTPDLFLLNYAEKLHINNQAKVVIYDMSKNSGIATNIMQYAGTLSKEFEDGITLVNHKNIYENKTHSPDLLIVSIRGWKEMVENRNELITGNSSVLIMQS